MKICSTCKIEKSLDQFGKRTLSIDGLAYICKSCKKEYGKTYYNDNKDKIQLINKNWYKNNLEKSANYVKKYQQKNKKAIYEKQLLYRQQNKDKERIRLRNWKRNNKLKVRECHVKYYDKNKKLILQKSKDWYYKQEENYHRERGKQWRKNNPIKSLLKDARRRARKNQAGGNGVTEQEWINICSRYGNKCVYCYKECKMTMDHVVPLIRGGEHDINNVVPACLSCNSSKCDKLLNEWKPEFKLNLVIT